MNSKELQQLRDALSTELVDLAEPIDFPGLEKQGVISKAGAWYRVHKMESLPRHATKKIVELAQDSKGLKVKFSSSVKFERIAKKVAKLGQE